MNQLTINEVGPRDGLQNQSRLISADDKLRLISLLVEAGLRHIEVSSFVSPTAVPQMADADELFLSLSDATGRSNGAHFSALVPNLRGLARAQQAGVREIAVVLAATETMNQRNINMSLTEARHVSADTVRAATAAGLRTKAYLAVAFECPFEGVVAADTVLRLAHEMIEAGADEIVIADTIGAAGPKAVSHLMRGCVSAFGSAKVSVHLHDTRGMAIANAWAALEVGVRKFDSSLGGLGGCPFAPGAAGNLATEDLVLLARQCGLETGVDMGRLRVAVKMAETLTGLRLGGRSNAWLDRQDQIATVGDAQVEAACI